MKWILDNLTYITLVIGILMMLYAIWMFRNLRWE